MSLLPSHSLCSSLPDFLPAPPGSWVFAWLGVLTWAVLLKGELFTRVTQCRCHFNIALCQRFLLTSKFKWELFHSFVYFSTVVITSRKYSRSLNNIVSFNCVLVILIKNWFPPRATDYVELARSPQVCVGFLWVLWFPPTSQVCATQMNWCV